MIKTILKSLREYKKLAIITPLLMVGEVVMEVLIPFIIANLVNEISAGCGVDVILKYGAVLFLMACTSLAFGAAAGKTSANAAAGFAKNLRHDLYYKVQDFSFENIDKFSSSSLVTRMTTDVNFVQMSFMMIIRSAIRSPLMFLFSIIMGFVMGGRLAMIFVVVVPVLAFGLIMIARKAMPAFRSVFPRYDKLNESVEENVMAMRAVKGFVREEYEKEKFAAASDAIRDDFRKAQRIVELTKPIMQVCLYSVMIFVLLVGSKIIISEFGLDINVGQLSSILTYGMQILMSLNILSMIYVMITMSEESMRRIVEVLEEESTLTNPENPVMAVKDGSIDFENVSFKYSARANRNALSEINLHIKSGQTVGVLGGTGSSKSTFVQLIPRLYDVTEGVLKVGGVDVRDYDIETLRNEVSVVLQKNQLFAGTIKDNLRWGDKDATDEEIKEACRLAQADTFVEAMPNGYDTWIEQGGTNVSGGQKQRLCIARALIKKPKILILDDSTSAVDTQTDALIRKGFREYIPETTKIIISQRVASVMDADLIVIMEGGKVAAVGTHDELLNTCDIYKEIHAQQTRGGALYEE